MTETGFKLVKDSRAIEFVADYRTAGGGTVGSARMSGTTARRQGSYPLGSVGRSRDGLAGR